ncbi:ribokinase [Spirochaetia bacterium]|nr:ribokinase [Spirochaetia bacterium]
MKILVFGSLNIDLIFSVDHIVRPGETISSSALEKSAGGKGANQAASLAKAGMDVYMAGKIGADGEFLLDLLESYGVHTENVVWYKGATGQALIQLDKNHQNSIVLFSGGNTLITDDEINRTLEKFGSGDILVLQNEINCTAELMRCAKERGLKIYLNPSPYDEGIAKLPLELADAFFVNEIEGAALAEMPPETPFPAILETLVKKFPHTEIILTAGKAGAFYGFKAVREKGNIIDLPVADTTAAGDTFTGYFIAARARALPVEEALALACKASSIAVSRKGAMASIPLAKEVFGD